MEQMSAEEYRLRQGQKPHKKQKKEEMLQIQFSKYMQLKHPKVIFRCDAAGLKMTTGQAIKFSKMQGGRAYPDVYIAHPNSVYSGLYIELKHSRSEIYLKDGSLSQKKHIKEQTDMLMRLSSLGYMALFACGLEEAICCTEKYLKIK